MKIIVAILALVFSLHAGLINAVAIVVGGKPITLYEIEKIVQQHNLEYNQAAELLVQRALEDIEMEKLGIDVSDYEVELEMEKMAQSNGLSLAQFQEMIVNSGIDYESYKEEFARKLKSRYLFDAIGNSTLNQPSHQALMVHYQNNQQKFQTFETATITQYLSKDRMRLQQYIQNPFSSNEGIQKQQSSINSAEINPNLRFMLDNTKEKSYTPIVEVDGNFISFYVDSKNGSVLKPFEQVQNEVLQSWKQSQREDAIKLHFQEVRANTDIQIIR